jgi:hypothetical protein
VDAILILAKSPVVWIEFVGLVDAALCLENHVRSCLGSKIPICRLQFQSPYESEFAHCSPLQ